MCTQIRYDDEMQASCRDTTTGQPHRSANARSGNAYVSILRDFRHVPSYGAPPRKISAAKVTQTEWRICGSILSRGYKRVLSIFQPNNSRGNIQVKTRIFFLSPLLFFCRILCKRGGLENSKNSGIKRQIIYYNPVFQLSHSINIIVAIYMR